MTDHNNDPASPAPMTPEERAARYEQLRKRQALSPIFAEHRDPNKIVRWVRNDEHDVPLHKHLGFVFVRENPKTALDNRRVNTMVQLGDDGLYRIGDVILMEINKVDYEFYIDEGVRMSRERIGAGKQSFLSEAEKLGVPTFERNKVGQIK